MKKLIFLFSVAFFVAVLSISCEEADKSGKYLFNDELTSMSKSPLAQIDFHTFSFGTNSKTPCEIRKFNADHSNDMIFRSRAFLTGAAKDGRGANLTGICPIRFVKGIFKLLKFDETERIVFYTFIQDIFVIYSETTDYELAANLGFIGNEKVKKLGGGNQIT